MRQRILSLVVLVFACICSKAQSVNIIPKPSFAESLKGNAFVTAHTQIKGRSNVAKSATFLADYLHKMYGLTPAVTNKFKHGTETEIELTIAPKNNAIKGAYSLTVKDKKITITGSDEEGVFYGIQSLIQLLPTAKSNRLIIPAVKVKDEPRFAYRGGHFDVGRHFFDVAFIKKYIDLLAMYKFNTFHWHLTEDQAWRIEIKKYPELTRVGAYRNGTIINHYPGNGNDNTPEEGFYTQEQVKEIVAYAAARYITVIPEIELPGHSSAAIAAYPSLSCFPKRVTNIPVNMVSQRSVKEAQKNNRVKFVQETWGVFDDVYCAGKDSTFYFLQDVLEEVMALFPSKYIHIGGDECPKTFWKQCPACQKRIRDNHLKDEFELQCYFIERIEQYVNSKGKNVIGWDEILEGGLAPNAAVMSWRGEKGGIEAAKQHHNVVMTPGEFCYLNRANSQKEDSLTAGNSLHIEKVYSYNPVPAALSAEEAKYIMGAQACLWTEYITNPAKVEYMLLPRLSAMSEVLWTAPEKKNWVEFSGRLDNEFKRYDWLGLNYCKIYLRDKK
ncbi:beta-N-acetylhexosaminidase [Pinibacter soli]|uniref:beta-N-acetylhexosaminidase n=1 Tax=Pinibacter soli TaxID=3044211 RepID=A0ABT6RGM8_9BACT|nr:beta-N-acetylhexosaminidase [Pinibacter soli]MDI3321002.1 beta-N-acetylhexosaminidase [Pinibacter soli]